MSEELKRVASQAYTENDYETLIRIYNENRVAPDRLTDCCSYPIIKEWTKYAIETGDLPESKNGR